MKRAEKIEKELSAIFKDKISDPDLMQFAWGLESIKRIIYESKYLNDKVSFKKVREDIIHTFKAELQGKMDVLFGNTIIKAPLILRSSTIYGLIPQVMDELTKGIIRPEFQKDKIKPKDHYTKREAAEFLNITPGRINQLVDEGKLKFMSNKFDRKNCRVILGADLIEYLKNTKK